LRNKFLHISLIIAIAVVWAACNNNATNKLPSLNETFSKADKKPFGTYIAYRQIENMFSRNTLRDKKQSFDKTWNDISDTASLYICITPGLFVNDDEIKAMLGYVNAGNTLFIAANYIDDALLSEIGSKEDFRPMPRYNNFFDSVRTTTTKFSEEDFSYYYHPFKNSFSKFNKDFTKVLGVNDEGKPNYIVYFHGKGKLFLHCDPKAFSNYFLLKNDNYKYMQNTFAYTNGYPDHLYWDDYYRKFNVRKRSSGSGSGRSKSNDEDNAFSSFSAIFASTGLTFAFWLLLLLLLLYILFEGKRRQRIISKIKPNENTTVTFTETIGRLYLQKKDNKNIAEKMSTYFNEYVRNKYFLNTNAVNDDFITSLSRKAGVERDKVESLYRAIHHAHNNPLVDDYQLLSLNEQIQNFYKKH
jgi:hypothetical protein